jgi:DNA modification methylase
MSDPLYVGDVRDGLRSFIAAGIRAQTCVTSPPYWGLRDYGHDGQIGLERTPDAYVATIVDVFRLVRDVLADDGTLWLNLGDSYSQSGKGGNPEGSEWSGFVGSKDREKSAQPRACNAADIGQRPKNLVGIPWRLAFALQADGWYLRSDIIWHKPNPMPESVTDRPTKAHEYLFLLAKRERYYYDAVAIAEAVSDTLGAQAWRRIFDPQKQSKQSVMMTQGVKNRNGNGGERNPDAAYRNRRSVWTITAEPYADAHFATFPTALVEPCILAGSRPHDIVLDPFMGSGTVAQVAQSLGRRWIGCELNPAYAAMVKKRSAQQGLVLESV